MILYSGSWCRSCNLGLRELEEVRPLIEARGASLVAISPQTIPRTRRTMQITLPILSDKGGKIAVQYGVRWRVTELRRTLHLKSGIDLPSLHGKDSWTFPIPARFVVDQHGVIAYSEVDPDQTHRSNPSDLFPVLDRLSNARAHSHLSATHSLTRYREAVGTDRRDIGRREAFGGTASLLFARRKASIGV
ncbi:redoxin domain-containing protein [Bradyrhizobium sp. USDA 10063]